MNTNIFQLNRTALEQSMKQAYPAIASVNIVRGLPHTVRIVVALRTPALRWQSGDTTSILDADGESFEQGDKPEYGTLPKVIDKSTIPVQVGQYVVSAEFIHFLSDIQQKIPAELKKNILASEITETTFQVDVVVEGDIRLRFTVQRPLEEQLRGVVLIYQAHPEAKLIDVRVPQWGYWK